MQSAPPIFHISHPQQQTAGFVYNSPHSGRYYPPDMLAATPLSLEALRGSEDCWVDRLFAAAPLHGAPLLAANYARAYVDTNREAHELDPGMFNGPLPPQANTLSERVRAGLGTIPRLVAANQRIYRHRLPVDAALARLDLVYHPFHAALWTLLNRTRQNFGHAVLIDCHSMPSGVSLGRFAPRQNNDIVLGDCHGTSCAAVVTETAALVLRRLGYRVALNQPYSGGYNSQYYGQPAVGLHALQIEINRALYMDEKTLTPSANFPALAADLERLMTGLHAIQVSALAPAAHIAAEDRGRRSAE